MVPLLRQMLSELSAEAKQSVLGNRERSEELSSVTPIQVDQEMGFEPEQIWLKGTDTEQAENLLTDFSGILSAGTGSR